MLPSEQLPICFPRVTADMRWTSTSRMSYPEEFGVVFPFHLVRPSVAFLSMESYDLTCPEQVDIYAGSMNVNRLLTDPTSGYKTAVFSLIHSELIPLRGGQQEGAFSSVNLVLKFLVSPGCDYLRFLIHASGCRLNPYRLCEIVGVRCALLPTPEHYINEIALKTSARCVYMKQYFHAALSKLGDLSCRLLCVKGCLEDMLLKYRRRESDRFNTTDSMMTYLLLFDTNINNVIYMKRVLDKYYMDIISLSVDVGECECVSDGASLKAEDGTRAVSVLDQAEELLSRLEYLKECVNIYEEIIHKILNGDLNIIANYKVLRDHTDNGSWKSERITNSPCACVCSNGNCKSGASHHCCCFSDASGHPLVSIALSWPVECIQLYPLMGCRDIIKEFYLRSFSFSTDLYMDSSWVSALKKQVYKPEKYNFNNNGPSLVGSPTSCGRIRHHCMSSADIAGRIKHRALRESRLTPWLISELEVPHTPEPTSGSFSDMLDRHPPFELPVSESLAEHVFLQLWGPEMAHPCDHSACWRLPRIEWIVAASREQRSRNCRYHLQLYHFHGVLRSLLGIDLLCDFNELIHGDSDYSSIGGSGSISDIIRGFAASSSGAVDIFVSQCILATFGLLQGSRCTYEQCLLSLIGIYRLPITEDVDYISLTFCLILAVSSSAVGMLQVAPWASPESSQFICELTRVIAAMALNGCIGKCMTAYVITSIINAAVKLLSSTPKMESSGKGQPDAIGGDSSEHCCFLVSFLAIHLSLLDSLVAGSSTCLEGSELQPESALTFIEGTYLSRDAISAVIDKCSCFSSVDFVRKSLQSLKSKLRASDELMQHMQAQEGKLRQAIEAERERDRTGGSRKKDELRVAIEDANRFKRIEEEAIFAEKKRLEDEEARKEREKQLLEDSLKMEAEKMLERDRLLQELMRQEELREQQEQEERARRDIIHSLMGDILLKVEVVCEDESHATWHDTAPAAAEVASLKEDEVAPTQLAADNLPHDIGLPILDNVSGDLAEAPSNMLEQIDEAVNATVVTDSDVKDEFTPLQISETEVVTESGKAFTSPPGNEPESSDIHDTAVQESTVPPAGNSATDSGPPEAGSVSAVRCDVAPLSTPTPIVEQAPDILPPKVVEHALSTALVSPEKLKEKERKEKRQQDLKLRLEEERRKQEQKAAAKAHLEREEAARLLKEEVLRRKHLEAEREAKEQLEEAEERVRLAREERRKKRIAEHEERLQREREEILAKQEPISLKSVATVHEGVCAETDSSAIDAETDAKAEEEQGVPIEVANGATEPHPMAVMLEPNPDPQPQSSGANKKEKKDRDGCVIS